MQVIRAPGEGIGAGAPAPAEWLRWLCLACALLAALPALGVLSFIWSMSEYLGHGYLIPVSSAAILWMRRSAIVEALRAEEPPKLGPLWVLLAATVESVGVVSEAGTIAGLGIALLLAATSYAVGGLRLLKVTALPIALLLLMVPPPVSVQDRVLIHLKSFVIEAAVAILQTAGMSVASTGNRILVPGHELFVADACSGLVSITTLLPLGVVVAYFLSHGVWRRIVVVASIVPLAMLGNLVRVVATVVLVSRHGMGYAEGLLHDTAGLATFSIGTIALVAIARLLR